MQGKAARALALAAVAVVPFAGSTATASAKSTLPHWKSKNGKYVCHRHTKPVAGHRVHCIAKHKPVARKAQGSTAWVLPRYVVMCESGGNERVVNRTPAGAANGFPAGLYQITGPTWRGYGGGKFAPTADQATIAEQGVIAKRVLAAQGPRAWACW